MPIALRAKGRGASRPTPTELVPADPAFGTSRRLSRVLAVAHVACRCICITGIDVLCSLLRTLELDTLKHRFWLDCQQRSSGSKRALAGERVGDSIAKLGPPARALQVDWCEQRTGWQAGLRRVER